MTHEGGELATAADEAVGVRLAAATAVPAALGDLPVLEPGAQAATATATVPAPISASTSRRDRTRPIRRSSSASKGVSGGVGVRTVVTVGSLVVVRDRRSRRFLRRA